MCHVRSAARHNIPSMKKDVLSLEERLKAEIALLDEYLPLYIICLYFNNIQSSALKSHLIADDRKSIQLYICASAAVVSGTFSATNPITAN